MITSPSLYSLSKYVASKVPGATSMRFILVSTPHDVPGLFFSPFLLLEIQTTGTPNEAAPAAPCPGLFPSCTGSKPTSRGRVGRPSLAIRLCGAFWVCASSPVDRTSNRHKSDSPRTWGRLCAFRGLFYRALLFSGHSYSNDPTRSPTKKLLALLMSPLSSAI